MSDIKIRGTKGVKKVEKEIKADIEREVSEILFLLNTNNISEETRRDILSRIDGAIKDVEKVASEGAL